jgi:benzoyl-CoA reductase/2-hydroxyglutaryl-CoA dehydratase subunit BcrC/BadD/HgdB
MNIVIKKTNNRSDKMYYVTRWSVVESLRNNPNLTFEQLKEIYPLADDEEILEGIKEYIEELEQRIGELEKYMYQTGNLCPEIEIGSIYKKIKELKLL